MWIIANIHHPPTSKTTLASRNPLSFDKDIRTIQNHFYGTSGIDCKEYPPKYLSVLNEFWNIVPLLPFVCLDFWCFCYANRWEAKPYSKTKTSALDTGLNLSAPAGFNILGWVSTDQNTDWKIITWDYKTFKQKLWIAWGDTNMQCRTYATH